MLSASGMERTDAAYPTISPLRRERMRQRQHRPVTISLITMALTATAHHNYGGHQLASARTDKGPLTIRAHA